MQTPKYHNHLPVILGNDFTTEEVYWELWEEEVSFPVHDFDLISPQSSSLAHVQLSDGDVQPDNVK